MSKAPDLGDYVADAVLFLTGIGALAKGAEVIGDLAGGNRPKVADVVGALGAVDAEAAVDSQHEDLQR